MVRNIQARHMSLPLLSACLFFSSCSDNNDSYSSNEPVPQESTYSFYTEAAKTRSSVDESSYAVRWDKSDKIDVWMGENIEHLSKRTFSTNDGGVNKAYFTYTGPATKTNVYFGFYPSMQGESANMVLTIPTDGTIMQQQPGNSLHLDRYQAMYTRVITRQESTTVLDSMRFHHLASLVVFNVDNVSESERTYKTITLKTENGRQVFSSTASYRAGSNDGQVSDLDRTSSSVMLRLNQDAFSTSNGTSVQCFLPLWPSSDITDTRLVCEIQTAHRTYRTVFSQDVSRKIGAFEAGTYYVFNLKVRKTSLELLDSNIIPWEDENMGDVIIPGDG